MEISFIVPVHNEERILESSVTRLVERLAGFPGSQVLLVENGSRDGSWALASRLAVPSRGVLVRAFREPRAGIGYAYHRGLSELNQGQHRDGDPSGNGAAEEPGAASHARWAVLTAADLPFDFTDLEQALPHLRAADGPRLLIGSKAHPRSQLRIGLQRRLASRAYRYARRLVLGMKVGDSQGSVFIRADLAAALVPGIASRDFFYSTELIFLAERAGERVVEVPVVLAPSLRGSSVRPLRDGLTMGRQLFRLARAARRSARDAGRARR